MNLQRVLKTSHKPYCLISDKLLLLMFKLRLNVIEESPISQSPQKLNKAICIIYSSILVYTSQIWDINSCSSFCS